MAGEPIRCNPLCHAFCGMLSPDQTKVLVVCQKCGEVRLVDVADIRQHD